MLITAYYNDDDDDDDGDGDDDEGIIKECIPMLYICAITVFRTLPSLFNRFACSAPPRSLCWLLRYI